MSSGAADIATLPLAKLDDGVATTVTIAGEPVAVVRIGAEVFAIGDTCSHGRASLSGGPVWADELLIECPKHGSTFDLRTGVPTCLPATKPVATYDVTIDGVAVTVRPTTSAGGDGAADSSKGTSR